MFIIYMYMYVAWLLYWHKHCWGCFCLLIHVFIYMYNVQSCRRLFIIVYYCTSWRGFSNQFLDMEDPSIVPDLRFYNQGSQPKFDEFWDEYDKFLQEDIDQAVDDRRHGQITHLSRAISIRDLVQQVKSRCSPSTPIASVEWVRLQFWPKTLGVRTAVHYTGRFPMKFMIQQRQLRKNHPDSRYAAAIFRYMREYAVKVRDYCSFVCACWWQTSCQDWWTKFPSGLCNRYSNDYKWIVVLRYEFINTCSNSLVRICLFLVRSMSWLLDLWCTVFREIFNWKNIQK